MKPSRVRVWLKMRRAQPLKHQLLTVDTNRRAVRPRRSSTAPTTSSTWRKSTKTVWTLFRSCIEKKKDFLARIGEARLSTIVFFIRTDFFDLVLPAIVCSNRPVIEFSLNRHVVRSWEKRATFAAASAAAATQRRQQAANSSAAVAEQQQQQQLLSSGSGDVIISSSSRNCGSGKPKSSGSRGKRISSSSSSKRLQRADGKKRKCLFGGFK